VALLVTLAIAAGGGRLITARRAPDPA
jgi:hypothetical protein